MARSRRIRTREFQRAAVRFKDQATQLGTRTLFEIPDYNSLEAGWIIQAQEDGYVIPYVRDLHRLYESSGLENAVKEMAIDPLVRVGG